MPDHAGSSSASAARAVASHPSSSVASAANQRLALGFGDRVEDAREFLGIAAVEHAGSATTRRCRRRPGPAHRRNCAAVRVGAHEHGNVAGTQRRVAEPDLAAQAGRDEAGDLGGAGRDRSLGGIALGQGGARSSGSSQTCSGARASGVASCSSGRLVADAGRVIRRSGAG